MALRFEHLQTLDLLKQSPLSINVLSPGYLLIKLQKGIFLLDLYKDKKFNQIFLLDQDLSCLTDCIHHYYKENYLIIITIGNNG